MPKEKNTCRQSIVNKKNLQMHTYLCPNTTTITSYRYSYTHTLSLNVQGQEAGIGKTQPKFFLTHTKGKTSQWSVA